MMSTCACHFGGFGRPIRRRCRIAIATRPAPIAIFTASAPSEGAVVGSGGLFASTEHGDRDYDRQGHQPPERPRRAFSHATL